MNPMTYGDITGHMAPKYSNDFVKTERFKLFKSNIESDRISCTKSNLNSEKESIRLNNRRNSSK